MGQQERRQETYIPVKGSTWRLALADVRGNGEKQLVYGAYDGAVRCQDLSTGELLWETSVNSFPFAVATGDVDGDGRAEVFAAAADGGLYAIDGDGEVMWTFRSPKPLYDVAVGRLLRGAGLQVVCGGVDRSVHVLTGRGEPVARHEVTKFVHRLAVADLDGDGLDEIFIVDRSVWVEAIKLFSTGFDRIMWRRLEVPEGMKNWENPLGFFFAYSLDVGDLNGDGAPEIVMGDTFHNGRAVMAMSAAGRTLWVSRPEGWKFFGETYSELYSTAFVCIGDVVPDLPGKQVVSVAGGLIKLLDSSGEEIARASSRVGFTDAVLDGTTLYLGSSPNGDDTVYRIELDGDWQAAVEGLERQGAARKLGGNLSTLRRQVLDFDGAADPDREPHHVRLRLSGVRATEEGCRRFTRLREWLDRQFPYDNLRWLAGMKAIESEPPLDETGQPWSMSRWRTDTIRGTMTADEIVEAARFIEERGIPTLFNVGHSCMPFIALETAARMLRAAPRHLMGFITSEDEDLERIPRYFRHYFGPLADLCAEHGGKLCITKNKYLWWAAVPTLEDMYGSLFSGRRSEVLVANVEDSNSRTGEINLFGRFGLWMAGLIDRFDVSAVSDLHSPERSHQWEYPKHGHPYLRLLVAHTVLGGLDVESRIMAVRPHGDSFAFTDIGRESVEIFLHMVGKGLVFSPRREDVMGISPLGIAMHRPPARWFEDAHNGHHAEITSDDPELHDAVIPHNGCGWGRTETPAHALQAVLLHKRRQGCNHVPATPYGPPVIVPAQADLSAVPRVREWWHTDGVWLWRDGGEKLTGRAAARALKASAEKAAAALPFRPFGDDVFFQVLRLDDRTCRLYAVDPGWLDPARRWVRVRIQQEGRFAVKDLLTGGDIPVHAGEFEFEVPAGSLRILEASRR